MIVLTQQLGSNLCEIFIIEPRNEYTSDQKYYKTIQGLTTIPTDIPADALEVYLDYNNIIRIEANVFSHLSKCSYLYLHNNWITEMEPGAFNGLVSLNVLNLYANNINKIYPGAFTGLDSLDILELGNNDITDLEDNTFADLKNLKELSLFGNDLTILCPGMFCGLNSLKELFLYDNRLTRLSADVFNHLPRPLQLALYVNTTYSQPKHPELLVCDSELCWLKKEEQQGTITWFIWYSVEYPPKCAGGVDLDTWDCNVTGDVLLQFCV